MWRHETWWYIRLISYFACDGFIGHDTSNSLARSHQSWLSHSFECIEGHANVVPSGCLQPNGLSLRRMILSWTSWVIMGHLTFGQGRHGMCPSRRLGISRINGCEGYLPAAKIRREIWHRSSHAEWEKAGTKQGPSSDWANLGKGLKLADQCRSPSICFEVLRT